MKDAQQTKERRRVILSGEGNLLTRIRRFLLECWAEFKHVQRPTRQEVGSYSMAVLFVVVVSASYLALLDVLLAKIFELLRLGGTP